jgi:hypothetical protein
VGVRTFAVHAGEVLASAFEVDARFLYREARVGGVGPPGDVAPGKGEGDGRLVAFFSDGYVDLRPAQRFRDGADLLQVLGVVEEFYTGPEAVLGLGHAPPELVLEVELGSHLVDRGLETDDLVLALFEVALQPFDPPQGLLEGGVLARDDAPGLPAVGNPLVLLLLEQDFDASYFGLAAFELAL